MSRAVPGKEPVRTMGLAFVRPATIWDCIALAKNIRPEDREEVLIASGQAPLPGLLHSVRHFPKSTWAVADPSLCAMFGVSPYDPDPTIGVPWLLATPQLLQHKRQLFVESPRYVEELGRGYRLLANFVYERNKKHMRWLEWAGFKLTQRFEEYGVGKKPFWLFVKEVL